MSDAGTPRYTLVLEKQDFKFSCAHFTVFDAQEAELLHGHNYHVRVELTGATLDAEGILADVARVKAEVRRLCRALDSRTLVPEKSPHLAVRRDGDGDAATVEVRYRARRYLLPASEVVLLPLANTSIELLAAHLFRELVATLDAPHVDEMAVSVEETAGQLCVYRAPVR